MTEFAAIRCRIVRGCWPWAAALLAAACATASEPASPKEVIRERYPDGRVKIEREVTIDADGNYVNHGAWRMWNPAGKLIAEGSYSMGRRWGEWTRWLAREDAALLSAAPFDKFESPFVSRVHFVDDRMDGDWTIEDAAGRACSRVTLKNGRRNGPALQWLPDGRTYREASFRNALPEGELRELDAEGQIKTVATYVGGQQLLTKVSYFPDSEKKQLEFECLGATIIEAAPDDFWQSRFAQYEIRDELLRHGTWKSWYSNGQLELEGYYQHNRESGNFTWWHAHGQEAVRGSYIDGQPDGTWTWWYANGQKAAEGQFAHGTRMGTWRQWADDGRLVQRQELGENDADPSRSQGAPRWSQHRSPGDSSGPENDGVVAK
jgi:antitoxin component YwqK of YwqJK toxin-antitoxin module